MWELAPRQGSYDSVDAGWIAIRDWAEGDEVFMRRQGHSGDEMRPTTVIIVFLERLWR